ncbi:pseudouridine synthase [Gymnopus androsaceus JB14]|uniref:Pseudouridine synthase n=1 Tax=Gymnopus androsaceus JB14 TaxID=1447944 RepID=A0A6A4HPA6_9AGAR|nr:pseudouridine synthase [Gymnopus androsaceus JB14]
MAENNRKNSKDKKRNPGRRKRDGDSGNKRRGGEWGPKEQSSDMPKEPRLPKRDCALMIGFCGSAYRGMQFQKVPPGLPEPRTIEGELFKALVAAGAVSKDNADDPVKVGLSRAARTDAGVHAVGNVVSLKMIMSVPGVDDMLIHINSKLPADIRVWGFVSPSVCDARKYTYFFPSYLLISPKPGSGLDRVLREHASSQGCEVPWKDDPFWSDVDPETSTPWQEDMIRKRAWRVTPAHMERLRVIIEKFEKTHNFHNFTVAKDPKDKTNHRFMKKLEVGEPAVYGETEWIAISLDGQSFILHQRKMMFALTPATVLDELNETLDSSDPDYRELVEFEKYSQEMNAFKKRYIYDNMRSIEDRKGLFDAWIRAVDSYKGTDLLYLNPKGVIPPEAIVKKGEHRQIPFRERKVFNMTSFAEDDHEKDEADVEVEELLTKKQLEETES